MRKIFREIIIRLLYLTPIGYLLSFIGLSQNLSSLIEPKYRKNTGIRLSMISNESISAEIKNNPSLENRLYWFFNGTVLIGQTWFILSHSIEDNFIGAYAVLAAIFGSISVVSAIYPRFPWNKELFLK